MRDTIEFSIEEGNILTFNADVVALKYAQAFYGADYQVAGVLREEGVTESRLTPSNGSSVLIRATRLAAPNVLFIGVAPLYAFGYREIKEYTMRAFRVLKAENIEVRHLAMTIHGPGYGLDEFEALKMQFEGCRQAIQEGIWPKSLEKISIVEWDNARVTRLRSNFKKYINVSGVENPSGSAKQWAFKIQVPSKTLTLETSKKIIRKASFPRIEEEIAKEEWSKPHAFVAMPFQSDMEDLYYYGIQSAVHANELLCERVDKEAFTGDILARVKKKIETAALMIAEITGANPNVYLEIGYAWGSKIPTVLIANKKEELRFDVRGQRCLKYENIRDLEKSLTKELRELLGAREFKIK